MSENQEFYGCPGSSGDRIPLDSTMRCRHLATITATFQEQLTANPANPANLANPGQAEELHRIKPWKQCKRHYQRRFNATPLYSALFLF
jgi:hypothetical protein